MMKAGMFKDISKSFQQPKFAFKVIKEYPSMKVNFNERMLNSVYGYEEEPKFNWQKITNEKQKLEIMKLKKLPQNMVAKNGRLGLQKPFLFPDSEYKFSGLPGLIVKIEDADKNYSWELTANKN